MIEENLLGVNGRRLWLGQRRPPSSRVRPLRCARHLRPCPAANANCERCQGTKRRWAFVCVAEGERRVEERPIILVVEVDETIKELIGDALTEGGYQPAIVASVHEAVTLLQSGQANYRALVIDIYPTDTMNGWEAVRKARKIAPDLPVLYITAGAGNEWPSEGVASSVLLQKPFALAQLVTAVSQFLITASAPPRAP